MFDFEDPQRLAMLMAAAGLLSPQSRGMSRGSQVMASLGQGLEGYAKGGLLGSQNKRRNDVMGQEAELRRMQIDQAKRNVAGDEYAAQGFKQFFNSGAPVPYNDATGAEGPQGPVIPQSPPKMDFGGYGAYLGANPATAGRAMPYIQAGMKDTTPIAVPEGGALLDRSTGQPIFKNAREVKPAFQPGQTRTIKSGRVEITQEFDGKEWKQIAKSAIDKPEGPDKGPAAPAGFRFTPDGNLQAIPGGPADTKAGDKAEALQKREAGALARADMVLGNVREAIKESGVTTAGPLGAIGRNIPGTGAYNLNKKLDAIRSNIGFAELQAMREASPTGGALGQVAVQELNMLQSVLGSLDTAQSPAQLEKNLYAIEKHYTKWKQAVQGAAQEQSQGGFKVLGVE